MEFNIAKNSTLPVLKMQIVKDGITSLEYFNNIIENSLIYFSMKNTLDGTQKILNKKAGFTNKTFLEKNSKNEYYVYYKFSKFDTKIPGRYEGEFVFLNENGNYVLPLRENLYINVLDI
jgi:hypothetical protein